MLQAGIQRICPQSGHSLANENMRHTVVIYYPPPKPRPAPPKPPRAVELSDVRPLLLNPPCPPLPEDRQSCGRSGLS